MKLSRNPVSNRGFTLVEALLATAVTAALVVVIFLQTREAHVRSLQTKCIKNVRALQFALSQYLADNDGIFPVDQGTQIAGQWRTMDVWAIGNAMSSGTLDSLTQGTLYPYVGRAAREGLSPSGARSLSSALGQPPRLSGRAPRPTIIRCASLLPSSRRAPHWRLPQRPA